jgi:FkbM family methyltransferase
MRIDKESFTKSQFEFVDDFIRRPGERYVYGRTQEGASVAKEIAIDGFIDDFTSDKSFIGIPCIRLEHVPRTARIVSAVVQAYPITVTRRLKSQNFEFVDYFAFKSISKFPLMEIPYWIGAQEHFVANNKKYSNVYENLVDKESKEVFERIINFRLNYDLSEMESFSTNLKGMYFESFLKKPKDWGGFHDKGEYDGYNSENFFQLYPNMGMAVLFEPIPTQANLLLEQFKSRSNFKIFELAISNGDGVVKFNVDSTASHLSKDGTGIAVRTNSLDTFCDYYNYQPDFIKMDIEGSEIRAIKGAVQTIGKFKPNLAISVYHDVSHLTEAYELISKIYPAYTFYLRHYTEGYTETVLFAVP